VSNIEDALRHVRRLKAQGAISIKNYNQPRREQRQQVIEAARQEGMLVVAEGGSLYHMDMNLIADGSTGIEHNVPALNLYDDVIQFWSASQTGYTPTLVVVYGGLTSEDRHYAETDVWKHPILSKFVPPTVLQPRSVRRLKAPERDYRDDDAARAAKRLLEAGVVVNTGAHGQREGLATHWEMWSFARGGMTAMQVLSLATINPAEHLGMANDLGSIEVGKLADLVIMNSNPLENIRMTDDISHVMLNGRLYRAKDLSEEVTGSDQLEPFWFSEERKSRVSAIN
jgi:imidazolonepropionase-like amidohydrolase